MSTTTVDSPYAPDFKISPFTEVDYGCAWRGEAGDDITSKRYRVTYVAVERKVVAVRSNDEWIVLASDIDFAVVETLLARPYYTVGRGTDTAAGWATAHNKGETIDWVARRLRAFKHGSDIVSYTPKAGTDRWTAERNALAKAVRHHAFLGNIVSVGGGWYRTNGGTGRSYAQGHSDYASVARSSLLNLGLSSDGTYRWAVAK